jgi:hypothetical protein
LGRITGGFISPLFPSGPSTRGALKEVIYIGLAESYKESHLGEPESLLSVLWTIHALQGDDLTS